MDGLLGALVLVVLVAGGMVLFTAAEWGLILYRLVRRRSLDLGDDRLAFVLRQVSVLMILYLVGLGFWRGW